MPVRQTLILALSYADFPEPAFGFDTLYFAFTPFIYTSSRKSRAKPVTLQ